MQPHLPNPISLPSTSWATFIPGGCWSGLQAGSGTAGFRHPHLSSCNGHRSLAGTGLHHPSTRHSQCETLGETASTRLVFWRYLQRSTRVPSQWVISQPTPALGGIAILPAEIHRDRGDSLPGQGSGSGGEGLPHLPQTELNETMSYVSRQGETELVADVLGKLAVGWL